MSGKLSGKEGRVVVGRPLSATGTDPGKELRLESNQKLPIFIFPNTTWSVSHTAAGKVE